MKAYLLGFLIIITALLTGCGKNVIDSLVEAKGLENSMEDKYLFSIDNAILLARSFDFDSRGTVTTRSVAEKGEKTIGNYRSFGDKSPVFHVINYEEGGFVIISGDTREYPVLAYSNNSLFDFDEELPPGLSLWMDNVTRVINGKRANNEDPTETVMCSWNNLPNSQSFDLDIPQTRGPLPESYSLVLYHEAFLTTNWDQKPPYNDALAYMGCTNFSNGRVPAGCIAVAMAQIMRYHAKPANINWSSMANSYTSSQACPDLANLLYDLDLRLGAISNCNSTRADEDMIKNVLKWYGYSNVISYLDYEAGYVSDELSVNRPVILYGKSSTTTAHVWVCDAVHDFYDDARGPQGPFPYWYSALHMNWGWGGLYNGFFADNYFKPGPYTYNNIKLFLIYP